MNPLLPVTEVFNVKAGMDHQKEDPGKYSATPVWDRSLEAFLTAAGLTPAVAPWEGLALCQHFQELDTVHLNAGGLSSNSGAAMEQSLYTENLYCSHC